MNWKRGCRIVFGLRSVPIQTVSVPIVMGFIGMKLLEIA